MMGCFAAGIGEGGALPDMVDMLSSSSSSSNGLDASFPKLASVFSVSASRPCICGKSGDALELDPDMSCPFWACAMRLIAWPNLARLSAPPRS